MCDFKPVRNWEIALWVVVSAAASSAILAAILAGFPATVLAASICFWAAASWCLISVGVAYGLLNAIFTFCDCTSKAGKERCAEPCSRLRSAVFLFIPALLIAGAIFVTAAVGVFGAGWQIPVIGLTAMTLWGSMIGISATARDLERCQT